VSRRTLFDLILKTDHTEEEFDNTKGVIKIKGQQHTHTTKDSTLKYRVCQIQSLIIHIKDPTPLYNFNYLINTNIYNNEFFKENQFK
jgi:hypothetical protein